MTHSNRRASSHSHGWSAEVTETSDALDLEHHVFARSSPSAIAQSLKRSAERSKRRKSTPYQPAMSMLTFYINRAGRNLPAERKRTLEAAKEKLRELFGRRRRA
ncbi:MAG: DUF3175 domain-containing protein [Hyphomicrobiales bacterium]|nr:DUF3175 domain-containing protein [Hyphomicrobiales bacterium]